MKLRRTTQKCEFLWGGVISASEGEGCNFSPEEGCKFSAPARTCPLYTPPVPTCEFLTFEYKRFSPCAIQSRGKTEKYRHSQKAVKSHYFCFNNANRNHSKPMTLVPGGGCHYIGWNFWGGEGCILLHKVFAREGGSPLSPPIGLLWTNSLCGCEGL